MPLIRNSNFLAKKTRSLIAKRELTTRELSQKLNWSRGTIDKAIDGQSKMSSLRIQQIAKYLDVAPSDLIDYSPNQAKLKRYRKQILAKRARIKGSEQLSLETGMDVRPKQAKAIIDKLDYLTELVEQVNEKVNHKKHFWER